MSIKMMPVPQTLIVSQDNPEEEYSVSVTQNDHLSSLKALAKKLHLETQRSSHMELRVQLESLGPKTLETSVANKEGNIRNWSSLKWVKTSLDFGNVAEALEWIRKELREMRVQDQQISVQLMHLHSDLNKLKIEQVCKQHRKMLNDATFELEERYEMLDLLCDVPTTSGFRLSTPLKLIGITKMNISSRRFSLR